MFRMNAAYLLPVALLLACHAKESDSDTDLSVDTAIPLATGIQWFDEVRPADITPNGRTVLVQVTTSLAGELRFIDTETGDMRRITDLGDATADLATGLSADLKVSAFYGYPVQAGVWSERTDWVGIASPYSEGCTDNIGAGWDISDDGSVVVGFMWDECAPLAFRQVDGGTVQILETLGDPSGGSSAHPTNRATVVSGDGQISAGFASHGSLDRSPAFWNAAGEGTLIDPKTQDVPGEILAIDRDGSTLVGVRGYDGFVWTPSGGFVDLGRPDSALGGDPVFPNAVTGDGATVFGAVGSEFFGTPMAFVWTAENGSRALQPLVEAAGVEIPEGWLLTNVLAASDDGSVIVGTALDADFAPKMFLLSLPVDAYQPTR